MCALYMGIEIPENDDERVEAVRSYKIMDTAPEIAYDDITELAAGICGCRAAYFGLFDERRMWLKSHYGLVTRFERPRELTLCAPTILQNDLLIVPDLTKIPRYADLPSVKGPPHARFYCGMPLINSEGYAVGTLCVFDIEPRELSPEQQLGVRRLARQLMTHLEHRRQLIEAKETQRALEEARSKILEEKERSDRLLLNVMPAPVADELKKRGRVGAHYYASATVLFTDFVDFTHMTETLEPKVLVDQLDDFFSIFDEIVARNRMERLKTIGDAYMAVSGLPIETKTHAVDACLAALEIRDAVAGINRDRRKLLLEPWDVRIGVHTGPVMAGVVGQQKFAYDIWGDAVNLAARMEQSGAPGRVNVSEGTYAYASKFFEFTPRGPVETKKKGPIEMYFVDGVNKSFRASGEIQHLNEEIRRSANF